MKHLNEYINESIFDIDDNVGGFDNNVKAQEVWEDLTDKYGIILRGADSGKISVKNIDFDKKGRIIFKDWPGSVIMLNFNGVIPDSIQKYGLGDLPSNVNHLYIEEFRGKISEARLEGNYKNISLHIMRGSVELDKFPKIPIINFEDVFIRNAHILPKRKPKNCTMIFNDATMAHVFAAWSHKMFDEWPRWIQGGQKVEV